MLLNLYFIIHLDIIANVKYVKREKICKIQLPFYQKIL